VKPFPDTRVYDSGQGGWAILQST